ncbi:hypothetical protein [Luteolibacter marinus]|uniref:hypothetical protein n=1 Tax=Luteolibacter marinus TaxID=2776705 RepID=UPI001865CCE7|nr:hypothetical protein [Luteolibacter marinus]
MNTKAQRKMNLSALCDAEQYEPIVAGCLSDKQAKALPARHLANGLSLMAELILTHYDGVAEAFTTNNGVELSLKLVIGPQKDELKFAYKPVSEVKDVAAAMLPEPEDPAQETMDFVKPNGGTKKEPEIVEAEVIPALPAPMMALPAPEKGAGELEAYAEGREAYAEGPAIGTNPYDSAKQPELYRAWLEGWNDEKEAEANEAGETGTSSRGGEEE